MEEGAWEEQEGFQGGPLLLQNYEMEGKIQLWLVGGSEWIGVPVGGKVWTLTPVVEGTRVLETRGTEMNAKEALSH